MKVGRAYQEVECCFPLGGADVKYLIMLCMHPLSHPLKAAATEHLKCGGGHAKPDQQEPIFCTSTNIRIFFFYRKICIFEPHVVTLNIAV